MHKDSIKKDILNVFKAHGDFHGHEGFFDKIIDLLILHSEKNKQYADEGNPLSNFKDGAEFCKKLLNQNFDRTQREIAYAFILKSKQILGARDILADDKKNTPDSLEEKLDDEAVYSIIQTIILKYGS